MSNKDKSVDFAAQFRTLTTTTVSLNKASDELTEAVGLLDEVLKKQNIGLTVWDSFAWAEVEPPEYSADQIGYAKVNGKWGIAIRHIWGNEQYDDDKMEGPWLFAEAPRQLRINAVDHLPKLIEILAARSAEMTTKLSAKTREVKALVSLVGEITTEQVSK